MGKTVNIGGRIHNPEVGNVVAGANEIYDDTKGKKQDVINGEVDAALEGLGSGKQDKLTFDQQPREDSTNPVISGGVYAADQVLQQAIEAILLLIPSAASALNKLADVAFVNSSIATASATFRGTYNLVTDLHLSVSASHQDIATALASVVSMADNNDYCFVQVPTSDTSSDIRVTERYKFNGTAWAYEYDLNNSGFTAQQWEAINSGITALLVQKLGALPTAAELATSLAGKQNVLTFDNVPVSGSNNPVKSGGLYELFAAIDAKFPSDASANNKLVAENRLAAYVAGIIGALDASFDLTSTDGHVTFKMTQADGVITSVQILTSDIASAQALTTLGGQVSTNASDIAALQDLYNALQQSAPEIIQPTDTWPVANPSTTVIYRVIDRVNTPPEYYSDYMFKASDLTTPVLMATYNNAIDPRPKKGSANLVTSGGVFDNMGALDVSELNATENPQHTLAPYATLDAALAAIPSDYQKGGMSIKFVQSSDNKYVQYRLMATSFSINTDDWQGEDITIDGSIETKAELSLVDDDDNCIVQFKQGHIKTKEFDSRDSATMSDIQGAVNTLKQKVSEVDDNDGEDDSLSFVDENSEGIATFSEGHIKTKYFDSRNCVQPDNEEDDDEELAFVDNSGNAIALFKDGHIKTKYFDSEDVQSKQQKFASIDMDSLQILGTSSKSGDTINIASGYSNRVQIPADLQAWYYKILCTVKIVSGTPNIVIGKNSQTYGTLFKISGSSLVVNANGEDKEPVSIGFSIVADREYTVAFSHNVSTTKTDTIELYDTFGNYFTYTTPYTSHSYGNPVVYSESSALLLEKFAMTMQKDYNPNLTRMIVTGHSYVEADSLGADRIHCFTSLMYDYNGEDSVINCGLGGDKIAKMNTKLPYFVKMCPNVEYVLMCIGGNDRTATAEEIIAGLESSVSIVENLGMKPVLFTQNPAKWGEYENPASPTVNAWIRQSGIRYVDLDKVFWNPDGTVNESLFLSDGLHPTIEGHLRIFRRIQMDCPYLF